MNDKYLFIMINSLQKTNGDEYLKWKEYFFFARSCRRTRSDIFSNFARGNEHSIEGAR